MNEKVKLVKRFNIYRLDRDRNLSQFGTNFSSEKAAKEFIEREFFEASQYAGRRLEFIISEVWMYYSSE